ncbi:MAG: tetratricopeptide repeat protein [Acidobacteria bacterium]|nr:tetratricopeptide repeat protein [Acidobacteriota bacterium]
MKNYKLLIASLVISSFLLIGCSQKYVYTNEELSDRISDKLNLTKDEAMQFIPFAANDKVKEIAEVVKKSHRSDAGKMDLILSIMLGRDALNIIYDKDANLNAYQVMINKTANCVSYTNLFIAIAREVGLNAAFVDVTQVQNYQSDDYIHYKEGHICAGVNISGYVYLVDFVYNPKNYKKYKIIDDYQAIANFLTMLGVEQDRKYLMTHNEENLNKAIYFHTSAISIDPKSTRAMNNLGVIFMRLKQYNAAKKLFSEALDIDESVDVARYNLAELMVREKDLEGAIDLLKYNADETIRDPFTHYRLGQIYFSMAKTKEAEFHLRKAISFHDNYLNPRLTLISLLLSQERYDDAEEILAESEKYFPTNSQVISFREVLKKNQLEGMISKLE